MNTTERSFFAFVLMPFSAKFDDIYRLGIKQAADDCNIRAERLDEQLFDEGMLDRIYRQIATADFVIADLSDRNANVFYELGYAHAKEKTCILLTKKTADIPFDLQHKRHIVYGESIAYLKEHLVKNIEWAKREAVSREERKISVETKQPICDLTTSPHSAEVSVEFAFDLHNKTDQISPEISAIYLYTGNQWKITSDGKECPHSNADVAPFKYRYSIPTSRSKIGRNGWAHVKINARRIVAQAWKGEVIKGSYPVRGRGILRLETTDGNYDHEFDFNLQADEIPF